MSEERGLSHRAHRVLDLMHYPDQEIRVGFTAPAQFQRGRDYTKDGQWFRLYFIPHVGKKTISELVEAGAVEIHDPAEIREWRLYRTVECNLDFGDLWVES